MTMHVYENRIESNLVTVRVRRPIGGTSIVVAGWPPGWVQFPKIATVHHSGFILGYLELTAISDLPWANNLGERVLTTSGPSEGGTDFAIDVGDTLSLEITKGMLGEVQSISSGSISSVLPGPGTSVSTSNNVATVSSTLPAVGVFNIRDYSPHSDGSDDSTALNAAIDAANSLGGGVVLLGPHIYGIGSALDATATDVTLRGVPGMTVLKKTVADSSDGILAVRGRYLNWTFEGITFDGSYRALIAGSHATPATLNPQSSRGLRFSRCIFRDLSTGMVPDDSSGLLFEDCTFLGQPVAAGSHQATRDPTPVVGVVATPGIIVGDQARNMTVDRCTFEWCSTGLTLDTQSYQQSDGVLVRGCTFASDHWDSPMIRKQFTPTSVSGLTVHSSGGFTATVQLAGDGNTHLGWRQDLATGTSFSALVGQRVTLSGVTLPLTGGEIPGYGDAIETDDGRRCRIVGAVSTYAAGDYWADAWAYSDDRTPCDPPATSVHWHLCRYYFSDVASLTNDTTLVLNYEPRNPFTGRLANADDGLTLALMTVRIFATTVYSGFFTNAGVRRLVVADNTFRGGWADQCSINGCPGAVVTGNRLLYGQDEGIDIDSCPRSVVIGNVGEMCGTSLVHCVNSPGSVVAGNPVNGWGITNTAEPAFYVGSAAVSIGGNTATVPAGGPGGTWSGYVFGFDEAPCTGTTLAGNTGTGTVGTITATTTAAPTPGSIIADSAASVAGTGAANVAVRTPGGATGSCQFKNTAGGTTGDSNITTDGAGNLVLNSVWMNGNSFYLSDATLAGMNGERWQFYRPPGDPNLYLALNRPFRQAMIFGSGDGTADGSAVNIGTRLGVGSNNAPGATLDVTATASGTPGQLWRNSGGTIASTVREDGSLSLVHMADSAAANDSLYYSTTASKLAYKDPGGTVNPLY